MLKIAERGVVQDAEVAVIAGICRAANGDLVVGYNSGGDLRPGHVTSVVRSTDNGRTWSDPVTRIESIFTRGSVEAGCSVTCLSSGRLLMPYADGFYLRPDSGNNARRAVLFCPSSDDHGLTWSRPKAQAYEGLEAFAFGRVVELSPDELLLPLWGSYDQQGDWVSAVLRSTDGGATWSDWSPIGRGADETPIALLPDGRVIALLRGYDKADPARPFHVSHSEDGGRSWSTPQRIALNGTAPSLHVTADGKLLAGFRSMLPGHNCHVALSPDGGVNWEVVLELEPPHGVWNKGGYPVLEDLADRRMIAVFHNHDPERYVGYNILEWR